MNINPEEIKKLIQTYAELDEEHQKKLRCEAYKLLIHQTALNEVRSKNKDCTEGQENIEEIVSMKMKEEERRLSSMLNKINQLSETQLASVFMMAHKLAGQQNKVQETDITITLNNKTISMENYIKMNLPNANYNEAEKMVNDFDNQRDKST